MANIETILIVPDSHQPFEDKKAWALMLKVGKALRPDHVIHLGDLADFYAVSSHSKDPQRATQLKSEMAAARNALKQLQGLGAKNNVYILGNHEDRLTRYLQGKAPELAEVVSIDTLLAPSAYGFKTVPYKQSYKLGRMRYTHDVGNAGKGAAAKSMEALGKNLVIGHTHRMEVMVGGTIEGGTRVGASFGWLGDKEAIEYLHKDKVAKDWALGFGLGYLDAETGYTHLVAVAIMPDYSCIVNGKVYRL